MNLIMYFLFLSAGVIFADISLLSEKHRQVVLCIKQVVKQYFDRDHPIALSIFNPQSRRKISIRNKIRSSDLILMNDIIIKEISSDIYWPTVVWHNKIKIQSQTFNTILREKPMDFIYVVRYKGFIEETMIEMFDLFVLYNLERNMGGRSKLILAFLEMQEEHQQILFEIMMKWAVRTKMYDVILILPRPNYRYNRKTSTSKVTRQILCRIYTWFPFRNPHQCGKSDNFVLIDIWKQDGNGNFENETDLFPLKIPQKFDDCPFVYSIDLSSTKVRGLEWLILNLLFDSIGVQPVVHAEDHEPKRDAMLESTFSNRYVIWQEMIENDSNESLNVRWVVSFPHLFSEIRWYVPCPKRNILHGHFYKVFDFPLWLLFFSSCLLSALVTFLINLSVRNNSELHRGLSYSFYCTWAVVTSVSVPVIPKSPRMRGFFILWVCYSFIMSTIFQSYFTSFLIEPGEDRSIATMEELYSSGLSLFTDDEKGLTWFTNYENLTEESMKGPNIIKKCSDPIEQFFTLQNSASAATDLEMKLKLQARIRYLKPCYFLYSAYAYYSAVFFPTSDYADAFNMKVLESFEAGLHTKIVHNYTSSNLLTFQNITRIKGKVMKIEDNEYFVLELRHLIIVFGLYLLCNFVCVFVLLYELFSFKYKCIL